MPENDIITITRYFNYKRRLNSVFSRDNWPRVKDETYVIKLDVKERKGTHSVSVFIDRYTVVYFDYFGIKYIPQEVFNKIKGKSITHSILRVQDDDSIMCGFYWITLIENMIAENNLLDYTNLFSTNYYKK